MSNNLGGYLDVVPEFSDFEFAKNSKIKFCVIKQPDLVYNKGGEGNVCESIYDKNNKKMVYDIGFYKEILNFLKRIPIEKDHVMYATNLMLVEIEGASNATIEMVKYDIFAINQRVYISLALIIDMLYVKGFTDINYERFIDLIEFDMLFNMGFGIIDENSECYKVIKYIEELIK